MQAVNEALMVCWNVIQTISIWDVLDMAIIAYLIYRLLTFVRKTSSANVIKGIVLLIAVMWIASLLHLSVVNYLLGEAFKLGVVVVIVLFQPEIRTFLEQVGKSKFKGFFKRQNDVKAIDQAITQVVLACADMSKNKVGALIVFERDISLEGYIKTGSIIDAEPAQELIKNIFYPNTPLHDGAVIIRDGRVAGAACMLPLSSNSNLSRDLGMRHRAGVGTSERSDAVVAIVSEETGSISVAVDGMLKRHLAIDTFEKLLRNELLLQDEPKKQRGIFKNRRKKLGDGK